MPSSLHPAKNCYVYAFCCCVKQNKTKFNSTAVIGDEILKGHVHDSNSHFITKNLFSLGVKVKKVIMRRLSFFFRLNYRIAPCRCPSFQTTWMTSRRRCPSSLASTRTSSRREELDQRTMTSLSRELPKHSARKLYHIPSWLSSAASTSKLTTCLHRS